MATSCFGDDPNTCSPNPTAWKTLSLTYVAYEQDNVVSLVLAVSSLLPLVILISAGTLILSRRDLHSIFYLTGQLLNEAVNYLLKHWFKEPRPQTGSAPAAHFGKYGWPSSHAQFIAFFATYMTLFVLLRLWLSSKNGRWFSMWKLVIVIALLVSAAIVCVGRVYLQQHSVSQVVCGALFGVAFGLAWFGVVHLLLTPVFPYITQWPICEFLMIRDCTVIPNIVLFEYTTTRTEACIRKRKRSYRPNKYD